jgi:hypothetical protein
VNRRKKLKEDIVLECSKQKNKVCHNHETMAIESRLLVGHFPRGVEVKVVQCGVVWSRSNLLMIDDDAEELFRKHIMMASSATGGERVKPAQNDTFCFSRGDENATKSLSLLSAAVQVEESRKENTE